MLGNSSYAQPVSVRGMATYEYSGRFNAEDQREARNAAKVAALETYFASNANPAMSRIFADRKDYFLDRVDEFLLSVTELSVDNKKSAKLVTVVIRADVNVPMLRAAIDDFAATAAVSPVERSLMTLLFMSRMQESVQSFDDRVYRRSDNNMTTDETSASSFLANEAENIGTRSIEISESTDEKATSTISTSETSTSGGSITRQANNVRWRVTSSQEINAAMSSVFSSAGYEVVEAQYVEAESNGLLDVRKVSDEFSTGDDLSSDLMRSTVDGIKAAKIPYLAIGTLDVGLQDTDPVSGNIRVYVTVTGRVMDVSGRFPRSITSVGPVQYSGLGPTETVARNNALALAAEMAAQHLVDEMNIRGVQ